MCLVLLAKSNSKRQIIQRLLFKSKSLASKLSSPRLIALRFSSSRIALLASLSFLNRQREQASSLFILHLEFKELGFKNLLITLFRYLVSLRNLVI